MTQDNININKVWEDNAVRAQEKNIVDVSSNWAVVSLAKGHAEKRCRIGRHHGHMRIGSPLVGMHQPWLGIEISWGHLHTWVWASHPQLARCQQWHYQSSQRCCLLPPHQMDGCDQYKNHRISPAQQPGFVGRENGTSAVELLISKVQAWVPEGAFTT